MFVVVSGAPAIAGKGAITCVTCKLKGCVGRCNFQKQPRKAD